MNKTHAANPTWTHHARYHVVWQVTSYIGIGLVSLGLLWIPGNEATLRAYLVGILALCIYGGFFAAAATMPLYGGRLYDENGYPPVPVTIMGRKRLADINLSIFTALVVLDACGMALVLLA